jgi:hypothetical protein
MLELILGSHIGVGKLMDSDGGSRKLNICF